MTTRQASERSLPLRERKKLRARRALAELAVTAFSLAGRHWVRCDGRGGRGALLARLDDAVLAIPASLDLAAPA
jgi:hypothetical protein